MTVGHNRDEPCFHTTAVGGEPSGSGAGDGEFVARINGPDDAAARAAFETVFLRDYAVVWKFAYRFVGSRDAAQDLAQDVFCSVWERRRALDVRGSLRTYLLAAVRLRALNVLRHDGKERTVVEHTSPEEPPPGMGCEATSPEEGTAAIMLEERLSQALDALPERQRSALVLRWEQGLSNREIARTLGIGEAAVSRLLARAARALRGVVSRGV